MIIFVVENKGVGGGRIINYTMMGWGVRFGLCLGKVFVVCQSARHSGTGYARVPGIAALV